MTLHPRIFTICLLLVAVSGCSGLPGNKPDAITTELSTDTSVSNPAPVRQTPPEDRPISVKQSEGSKGHSPAQLQPGNGRLINLEAASRPAATGSAAAVQGDEITLNVENEPIQAVVQSILGAVLNENYTISPSVTGNVTFSTSKPISSAQALPVLEMLLAWTNNALIHKQGRYEVVPIKEAIAGNLSPTVTTSARMIPGYQARVFPLKYIAPTEMQKLLKPYAKADAIVAADNARGMIVMAGTAFELQNYEHTINIFDVDWLKGMSVGVFGLRNVEVTKIMPEIDKIFGASAESPLAGMFRFIPMETTNSVIVITPQPEYLKRAEEWLYRMDIGVGENGTQLYVYDVKNVKAVDLSEHLNAIYTGRTSGTSSKSTSGNTAPGLRGSTIGGGLTSGIGAGATSINQQQPKPATPALTTTGTGTPNGTAPGGKETDIRITPIEENNQLLVMATPGEYDSILAAIRRLDVPPLQVQIEAKVLEVQLTGDLNYGVQWWFQGLINQNVGSNSNAATGYQYGSAYQGNAADRHRSSLGGGGSALPSNTNGAGLFYSFLNKNFEVAINALQTNGTTKTLSAPSLVVLNNQQASITVGDQIPIVTQSIIAGSLGTVGTSSTDIANTGIGSTSYISTGSTLQITPRVNPGGLVYMDVAQEITKPGTPAAGSGTTNPPISQRNLQTQIAVQSGQTVLLAGLIGENDQTGDTGVPLLGSIPILGKLFNSTTNHRDRTEIIVLIKPTVIYSSEDAKTVTDEYQSKFESLAPLRAKLKQDPQAAANPGAATVGTSPSGAVAPSPSMTTPKPTDKPNQ